MLIQNKFSQHCQNSDVKIPKKMTAEAQKIVKMIKNQNLPNNNDGFPDLCQITKDEARKKIFDFIEKVNANGGSIPVPECSGTSETVFIE